jgi:riboflavin synthase
MFTGLVETVGEILAIERGTDSLSLKVGSPTLAANLSDGDSVAVDGICLTVTGHGADWFTVDAVTTTVERTTIGGFSPGRRVNLEPALRAGSPMGGHIVQGHVDGVGTVVSMETAEGETRLAIGLPLEVLRYTVPRGSLTVDGVSLTVAELAGNVAELAIIPYTLQRTNLSRLTASMPVNLEADLIGKYVAAMMEPHS